MVYNPSYLQKSRHGIYYMRYPIPATLHPQGKHDYVRLSLKTYSKQEALILMDRLRYAGRELLTYLQGLRMDYSIIKEHVAEHFRQELKKFKEELASTGLMTDGGIERANSIIALLSGETHGLKRGSTRAIEHSGYMALRRKLKISSDDVEDSYNLAETYRLGVIKFYQEVLKANNVAGAIDINSSPLEDSIDLKIKGYSLSEVVQSYFSEHESTWSVTTKQSYRTYAKRLLELVDADINIANFDMALARSVRDKLAEEKADISTRTKNEYISFFASFFTWAMNHGYVNDTFFSKMGFKETRTERQQPKKREYTADELTLIHKALLNDRSKLKPHFFWITILGIYTGARQAEICQLWTSDVKQVDGVWTIAINEKGDDHNIKKLKTGDSERIVPLHNKLIELGFIDYVKAQTTVRIFPDLSYTPSKQNYSKNVSRWYNQRFMRDLGIKSSEVDYHSLRRSFIDGLIKADVEEHKVQQIVGHKRDGMTQSYSKSGYSIKQLHEAINQYQPVSP